MIQDSVTQVNPTPLQVSRSRGGRYACAYFSLGALPD